MSILALICDTFQFVFLVCIHEKYVATINYSAWSNRRRRAEILSKIDSDSGCDEAELVDFGSDKDGLDMDEVETGENAIDDAELQRYIEEEEITEENEISTSAIAPNRGANYVGQGKNNNTVGWSMATANEKIRTQSMKRQRSDSYPYMKVNFNDKVDTFKRILPPAIVEMIFESHTNLFYSKKFHENTCKHRLIFQI